MSEGAFRRAVLPAGRSVCDAPAQTAGDEMMSHFILVLPAQTRAEISLESISFYNTQADVSTGKSRRASNRG